MRLAGFNTHVQFSLAQFAVTSAQAAASYVFTVPRGPSKVLWQGAPGGMWTSKRPSTVWFSEFHLVAEGQQLRPGTHLQPKCMPLKVAGSAPTASEKSNDGSAVLAADVASGSLLTTTCANTAGRRPVAKAASLTKVMAMMNGRCKGEEFLLVILSRAQEQ